MSFITGLFSPDNFIYWIEILTILAVLLLLGYILYILNVFKKE